MQDVNKLRERYVKGKDGRDREIKTVDGNVILLEELNFKKCIIGSG